MSKTHSAKQSQTQSTPADSQPLCSRCWSSTCRKEKQVSLSKLYKNGNSIVVAIPHWILKETGLKPGDYLKFTAAATNYGDIEMPIIINYIKPHETRKHPSKT